MIITIDDIKKKTLSYSSLKQFEKSPEHFLLYLQERRPATEAQAFGSLVDKMILTPDQWESYFAILPPKPPYLKDLQAEHGKDIGRELYEKGKADYSRFLEENKGKTFVTQSDIDEAKIIQDKVWSNPSAIELLSKITVTQKEIRWTDKKTGLKIVAYLDGEGEDIVLELKTTQNANPKDFARDVFKYDYDLQAAIYIEAKKNADFQFCEHYFLAVEKSKPYGISVLKTDSKVIEYGQKRFRMILDRFKYCLDNDLFNSSYEFKSAQLTGYHNLFLPGYLMKELEE